MKRLTPWLLLAGDCAVLLVFVTVGAFSPPPGPTRAVMQRVVVSLAVLLAAWLAAGGALRAFDLRRPALAYLARVLAAALIAFPLVAAGRLLLGGVLSAGLQTFVTTALAIASEVILLLLLWRAAAIIVHRIYTRGPRRLRWAASMLGLLALAGLAALAAPRLYAAARYANHIYADPQSAPARPVAVVFGAALWPDGTPSSVLRSRVTTAADLYHAGKVQTLLFSGDGRSVYYNEPAAMRLLALELGVPNAAIQLDYAGYRTYDTCYRAGAVFGARQVMLVTQGFQLVRALFICNTLGLDALGVQADNDIAALRTEAYWEVREVFATAAAAWDVYIARPVPRLDNPVPAVQ